MTILLELRTVAERTAVDRLLDEHGARTSAASGFGSRSIRDVEIHDLPAAIAAVQDQLDALRSAGETTNVERELLRRLKRQAAGLPTLSRLDELEDRVQRYDNALRLVVGRTDLGHRFSPATLRAVARAALDLEPVRGEEADALVEQWIGPHRTRTHRPRTY